MGLDRYATGRPRQHERDLPPHWSVPWSDLMMVMFVMFAVMFSVQLTERDVAELFAPKEAARRPDFNRPSRQPVSAERVFRESRDLVAGAELENIDVALLENQAVRISVRGPMLFDLGKAELKPKAMAFLNRLAIILARNNYEVQVVGHTDNFPISGPRFPTNWELSALRATTVARYLIRQGRLEPGRFTVIGHALYRPAVPNDSLANKALNRRVEIIVTRVEYRIDRKDAK